MAGYDDSIPYEGPEELFSYDGPVEVDYYSRCCRRELRDAIARSRQIAARWEHLTSSDPAARLHRSSAGYDDSSIISYKDPEELSPSSFRPGRRYYNCEQPRPQQKITITHDDKKSSATVRNSTDDPVAVLHRSSVGYDDSIPYEGPKSFSYDGAVWVPKARHKRKPTVATPTVRHVASSPPHPPPPPKPPATRTSCSPRTSSGVCPPWVIEYRCKGGIGSRGNVVAPSPNGSSSRKEKRSPWKSGQKKTKNTIFAWLQRRPR